MIPPVSSTPDVESSDAHQSPPHGSPEPAADAQQHLDEQQHTGWLRAGPEVSRAPATHSPSKRGIGLSALAILVTGLAGALLHWAFGPPDLIHLPNQKPHLDLRYVRFVVVLNGVWGVCPAALVLGEDALRLNATVPRPLLDAFAIQLHYDVGKSDIREEATISAEAVPHVTRLSRADGEPKRVRPLIAPQPVEIKEWARMGRQLRVEADFSLAWRPWRYGR